MIIIIDRNVSVNELKDGSVCVTRPCILGSVTSHVIKSPYSHMEIASYLYKRFGGHEVDLIQNVFPDMGDDDREFLMSGITPELWARTFPKGDDDSED